MATSSGRATRDDRHIKIGPERWYGLGIYGRPTGRRVCDNEGTSSSLSPLPWAKWDMINEKLISGEQSGVFLCVIMYVLHQMGILYTTKNEITVYQRKKYCAQCWTCHFLMN